VGDRGTAGTLGPGVSGTAPALGMGFRLLCHRRKANALKAVAGDASQRISGQAAKSDSIPP